MIDKIFSLIFGTKHERDIKKLKPIVAKINSLEDEIRSLSTESLKQKTSEFRQQIDNGKPLDDILPEAFAVVREASTRILGMRHFDVQMMGGIVLHQGRIIEMKTGEGKTLVATLPVYLNGLTGKGVHVVHRARRCALADVAALPELPVQEAKATGLCAVIDIVASIQHKGFRVGGYGHHSGIDHWAAKDYRRVG